MCHITDYVDLVRVWADNRCRIVVPPVEHLKALPETPLDESEKIPLTQDMFERFVGKLGHGGCREGAARSRIGDFDPDFTNIYHAVLKSTPDDRGDEYDFVFFGT
ncbi:hypothetical protein F5J12DRAFT_891100 [Pisolithus orientalis]|uniref:uncharacterized protein n=1 Tax=Pisolithus orientalis TaxID=936130 RepID=UPI00222449C6|nr:uncharacterized protein F5J12DRAFT_891100 [Pisolithus orientalis]KAI6012786.1 hypothetical protein F5J12DRAFT_891100 [Pisolithus orientalis]